MEHKFEDIIYEKRGRVATVMINRPEVLNAFRDKTNRELVVAFDDANNDSQIGVVVLTGTGNKAFSAGGDVKWEQEQALRRKATGGVSAETMPSNEDIFVAVRGVKKPTIAKVRGWCIGGANVLAALCDMTIASETAKFGQNGPRMGSYNPFGVGYLSRIVGEKKAREIWFLCRHYNAHEALEMGLANVVVPDDKLDEEVDKWCKEILVLSPSSLRAMKLLFQLDTEHYTGQWHVGMNMAATYQTTEEAQEGMNAFLEKREPDFWRYIK